MKDYKNHATCGGGVGGDLPKKDTTLVAAERNLKHFDFYNTRYREH